MGVPSLVLVSAWAIRLAQCVSHFLTGRRVVCRSGVAESRVPVGLACTPTGLIKAGWVGR